MPSQIADARQERIKRGLRLRIARLRRRIDGEIRSTEKETRRLMSWRTYVETYPGHAVAAALGVGLAVSSGIGRGQLGRWLGLRMVSRAVDRTVRLFGDELGRLWSESTPKEKCPDNNRNEGGGADHE